MSNNIVSLIANLRKNNVSNNCNNTDFDSITIDQAYNIQKEVIRSLGHEVIGWKLGGTNIKTRNTFNVEELYWGPIFDGNITDKPLELTLKRGEVEVAFKLNSNIDNLDHKICANDLALYIDSVALSVEFPWSVFNSFGSAGVLALISDCCASGQCFVGEAIAFDEFSGFSKMTISVDGEAIESCTTDNLVDGVYSTVCDFINMSDEKGFSLSGGQWVFTGGLSSCKMYDSGDVVEITCDSLADITFQVK